MLTGAGILIQGDQFQVFVSSLLVHLSYGVARNKEQFLDQAQRKNIVQCRMQQQKELGIVTFSLSWV